MLNGGGMLNRGDLETIALVLAVLVVMLAGYTLYKWLYCRCHKDDPDCQ